MSSTTKEPASPPRAAGGRRPRGRPRDANVEPAVQSATLALLAEVGYDRLSIEAVAARAGVAKTTVYRRWAGKPELVLDAMRGIEPLPAAPDDCGCLRDDLLALMQRVVLGTYEKGDPLVVAAIMHAMRSHRELATFVNERLAGVMRRHTAIIIDRAIARGELTPAAQGLELFPDIGPAILVSRLVVMGEPVDEPFRGRLVDELLIPILQHHR
jgi:AcrR family transcriptional regulator